MNILNVEAVKTETSPGEFVTDGYQVRVAEAAESDYAGQVIYRSRFANKAVMKAAVLVADERFAGFLLAVEAETATEAGKRNLEVLVKADKLTAISQVVNAQLDADVAVDMIKVMGGNNIPAPGAGAEGSDAEGSDTE